MNGADERGVPVSEILAGTEDFEGRTVRVRGLLVAPAEGVYLVDLEADPDSSAVPLWQTAGRLVVDRPGLPEDLFGQVPPYVGGPVMYCDDAVLLGIVRRVDEALLLTDLRELTLTRSGTEYHVTLDRGPADRRSS